MDSRSGRSPRPDTSCRRRRPPAARRHRTTESSRWSMAILTSSYPSSGRPGRPGFRRCRSPRSCGEGRRRRRPDGKHPAGRAGRARLCRRRRTARRRHANCPDSRPRSTWSQSSPGFRRMPLAWRSRGWRSRRNRSWRCDGVAVGGAVVPGEQDTGGGRCTRDVQHGAGVGDHAGSRVWPPSEVVSTGVGSVSGAGCSGREAGGRRRTAQLSRAKTPGVGLVQLPRHSAVGARQGLADRARPVGNGPVGPREHEEIDTQSRLVT